MLGTDNGLELRVVQQLRGNLLEHDRDVAARGRHRALEADQDVVPFHRVALGLTQDHQLRLQPLASFFHLGQAIQRRLQPRQVSVDHAQRGPGREDLGAHEDVGGTNGR